MDFQRLFAQRIGGEQFGKVNKVFKFTIIDQTKRQFIADNPGVKVIDLGIGEPEVRTADNIVERLHSEALKSENRIYPCNGTIEFKQAAARYLKRLTGCDFDPETEIVHSMGAKNALAQLPFAFVNPGEVIAQTVPGYPVLPTVCEWLESSVVNLPITESNSFLPDIHEIEKLAQKGNFKLLLLNYPNNPTGAVAPLEFYQQIVALAHKYNFLIVQDAAYADYVFEGEYVSPFQVDGGREACLELFSLSKGFNMQGFRLGFVASCPELMKAFALAKDNTDNGQFIAIQKAGVEALDNSAAFLNSNREKYERRLERVTAIFKQAGIFATKSPATFYLYIAVPEEFNGKKFETAEAFSSYLISELGIVSVPWEEAGPHVRLSMTFEIENQGFANEEEVLTALEQRLTSGRL